MLNNSDPHNSRSGMSQSALLPTDCTALDEQSDDSFHSASSQFLPLNESLTQCFQLFPKNFYVVHINAQSIPSHYTDIVSSFDVTNIHASFISESFLKPCFYSLQPTWISTNT